ncbi:AI-2E family transporter [Gluconacetobacter tumulicola]|uniref:AI-2E family transporter n=1 Tax=Gluconacetobacter tumulicola TaxID=1017177 RepID=A0A7W4JF19_9PROT|nr:AI-2E family transporter [Gluconacetobacter tumulicola]MBB2180039.1 AI-2E family transporter [Gluconacetobacter tumulicola]
MPVPPHSFVHPAKHGAPRPTATLPGGPRTTLQCWAQGALTFGVIILTLFILGRFRSALFWGGVLAIVCWPLLTRLRRKWPSPHAATMAPAAIVLGIALVFIIPSAVLISAAAGEARQGAQWVRQATEQGIPAPAWLDRLPWGRAQAQHWWQTNLATADSVHELMDRLRPEHALATVEQLGHDLANGLVIMGFALLILFFFLRVGQPLVTRIDLLVWRLLGARGGMVQRQIVGAVRGALAGLVLVGLGEGVLIGLSYVLAGAPQPLLLGIFTALACMIPMVGGFALALCVLAILIKGSSLAAAIGVGLFGTIVLFLADHFIRPALIGGSIRLPFMWVLLGILGGLESCGLPGLFIGPAVMAVAHLLWRLGSGRAARPLPDGVGAIRVVNSREE